MRENPLLPDDRDVKKDKYGLKKLLSLQVLVQLVGFFAVLAEVETAVLFFRAYP